MIPAKCPECGSGRINQFKSHELICVDCGLVVEDGLIEHSSFIGEGYDKSAVHPALAFAGTSHMNGSIVANSWLMSTRQKNLYSAKKKIDLLASKFKLPRSVVTEANLLYKSAVENNLNVGRDNESFIYASIYMASIIHGIPKTPLEMVAFSDITEKKLLKAYSLIKQKLGIKVNTIDPSDLVPRFGSKLGLKPETITLAISIIQKIKDHPVVAGKHTKTIVASALYLATQQNHEPKTQREIANVTGAIEITIRKRSKEIIEKIPELMN